jgi:hypothetical protein
LEVENDFHYDEPRFSKNDRREVRLFFPVIVVWILAFALLVAVLPIVLLAALVTVGRGPGLRLLGFYPVFSKCCLHHRACGSMSRTAGMARFMSLSTKEVDMSEETRKILEMLQEGKIGVEEADKLLEAVSPQNASGGEGSAPAIGKKKYLRIQVEPAPGAENADRVNIRVPMKLIRAGLKLAAFLPHDAQSQVNDALREKGVDINLSKLTPADLEELVTNLDDLTVDVEGKQKVRIYSE